MEEGSNFRNNNHHALLKRNNPLKTIMITSHQTEVAIVKICLRLSSQEVVAELTTYLTLMTWLWEVVICKVVPAVRWLEKTI